MTPKNKAEELVEKYFRDEFLHFDLSYMQAKHCASIAVDEIIEHCYQVMKPFWEEVKTEIKKL